MAHRIRLSRVVLRNFKSIAACDVRLGNLTYLVGPNGAGKSNFLEALHLVGDSLSGSLDHALRLRGGVSEVRRKSSGHPNHFSIQLELQWGAGGRALYGFNVGALPNGAYDVLDEKCIVGNVGLGPSFHVKSGKLIKSTESAFPAVTADRLALVAASGLADFRPVYDALTMMGLYNLNPRLMREPQRPQDSRMLSPAGENLASVVGHLEKSRPAAMTRIEEYLQAVVPSIQGVRRTSMGPFETLEFRQSVVGSKHPWSFPAMNMSDGTLRALGVLVALFQVGGDQGPTLVGIEEPETALHPAAARALREALKAASQNTQIIVTSHSPELLDDQDLRDGQIRSVVQSDGRTLIVDIDEASRQMIKSGLFSAGELLRLGQLEPDFNDTVSQNRQVDLFADVS